MADQSRGDFMPALRFSALTRFFDPTVALYARDRAVKQAVVRHAAIREGEVVLDLGCGTGTLALMAHSEQPAAKIVGLDADPSILGRAREKADGAHAQLSFEQGMSTDLPHGDARFDVVLSTLFFHHLSDDAKHVTAREALRVLKPGGRLVVADVGRPQDPLMRALVVATVQLLDGRETTSLNVEGSLPGVFERAGFGSVSTADRFRTPIGTIDLLTASKPEK